MSGSAELGKCEVCGKESTLSRKYFSYDIKCDCCVGGKHFVFIRHCENCAPKAPSRIKITLEGVTPNTDFNLTTDKLFQVN